MWRCQSVRLLLSFSVIRNRDPDGSQDCPSVIEEWAREVLNLDDQCLFLPVKVA